MKLFQKYLKSEDGVAVIEFAFIMPFLIFLFLGVVDIVGYTSAMQRVTYASSLVGDIVAQFDRTISKTDINDIYLASKMVINPESVQRISDVRIEIVNYRKAPDGSLLTPWSVNNGLGTSCGAGPSSQTSLGLMSDGNDVIITQTCTKYKPFFLTFLGNKGPFSGETNIKSWNLSRPRTPSPLEYDPNN